jgi:hypothetical protein
MELIKLIMWLSAGAVIGWFASSMVRVERRLRLHKPLSSEQRDSKKS